MTKKIARHLALFFSFLCFGLAFENKHLPLKSSQDRADEFVCPPGAEGFFCVEVCTSSYYYCAANGDKYPLECPPGTVFDPYQPGQPACVSPENAICEDPMAMTTTIEFTTTETPKTTPTSTTPTNTTTLTTTEPSTTTDESTTGETTKTSVTVESTTQLSTTTRTPNTCGNSSTTNSFTCPESNGQFPYDDCSSLYWQCSNGNAYLNCCPANLVYNPALNVCDYYYNVDGCNPIKHGIENQKQKKMELNSEREPATTFICQIDGFFPTDMKKSCSSDYVSCVGGIAHYRVCPEDALFDPNSRICRKTHLVSC